ncbi:MAG: DUF6876 family protein [Chitinophagaceae bacterium]
MTNANTQFGSGNGSENFYQNRYSPIIYTDGVKDMAETCAAYWLVDLIISHQLTKSVKFEAFQVWQLERIKDDAFKITATDGNEKHLVGQQIPFSDFRYDIVTIWLVNGCLMLPNEY